MWRGEAQRPRRRSGGVRMYFSIVLRSGEIPGKRENRDSFDPKRPKERHLHPTDLGARSSREDSQTPHPDHPAARPETVLF